MVNNFTLSDIDRETVVFLFINGPHHVHHLILPAMNFAINQKFYQTVLISGSKVNTEIIRKTWHRLGCPEFGFVELRKPIRYYFPNYKSKLFPPPYTCWARIQKYVRYAAAVVSTSHEVPKYFEKYNIKDPALIYLYHGTGTREYGFDPNLMFFDLLLIPGIYHQRRLKEKMAIDTSKFCIIGHPKLDWCSLMKQNSLQLFDNQNPVFYYNPHWDMNLSSINKWGNPILEYFKKNKQFNLIFSPHPLIKHFKYKNRLEKKIKNINFGDNILIDMGSEASVDGTYNFLSDVYVGDVSSVVAEWICHRPRPCIFLNSHNIDWENNLSYKNWHCGIVISKISDLPAELKNAVKTNKFKTQQKFYVQDMVSRGERSPSEYSTTEIINFLQGK